MLLYLRTMLPMDLLFLSFIVIIVGKPVYRLFCYFFVILCLNYLLLLFHLKCRISLHILCVLSYNLYLILVLIQIGQVNIYDPPVTYFTLMECPVVHSSGLLLEL